MTYELTDEQYADLCAVFDVPLKVRDGFNAFAKAEDVVYLDADDDMCGNCTSPWKCNGPHIPADLRAKDESCTGGGSDK